MPIITSPEVAAAVLKQKAVKEHLKEQQLRDKLTRRTDPLRLGASAGLVAGGYGLKQLGDAAITQDDRRTVENLISLGGKFTDKLRPLSKEELENPLLKALPPKEVDTTYQNSNDMFYDYIDKAHRASNVKVYGQDVVPLIHKIKKTLGAEHIINPATASPVELEDAKHYDLFKEGPIPAFLHQIRKHTLKPDGDKGWLFNKGTPTKPDILDVNPTDYYNKTEKYLGDFINQSKGVPLQEASSKLNASEQMDIIRALPGYMRGIDPAQATAHDVALRNMSDAQGDAAQMYQQGAAKGLHALQDVPHMLGYGAMGLGALGAGLYGYNKFKKWKMDKKEKTASLFNGPTFDAKRAATVLVTVK